VLDEPTTGLDAAAAHAVLAPLRDLAPRRTVVIVTHDPVAMEYADRVLRLVAGRVVDSARADVVLATTGSEGTR
jgi:ATP-binding cassette, subfamily B, bacterial